jgi:chromosome segregation ATPase
MEDTPQQLRRGLFGYRTKAVRQTLADRETVLRMAQERAQAAETMVRELGGQLSTAQADAAATRTGVATLEAKLAAAEADSAEREVEVATLRAGLATKDELIRTLRAEIVDRREAARALGEDIARVEVELAALREASAREDSATVEYLMNEVGPIIAAAEESARRIIARAQRVGDQQIEETYRLWRSMQGELTRFGMWRDQIESLVSASKAHFEEARLRIAEMPDRMASALGPITQAIDVVNEDLGRLAKTSVPYVVVELGEAEAEHAASGTGAGTTTTTEPDGVTIPDAGDQVVSLNGLSPAAAAVPGANGASDGADSDGVRTRLDWGTPAAS